MDERRMKGLMGLCVRAGQAVFGEDACFILDVRPEGGTVVFESREGE